MKILPLTPLFAISLLLVAPPALAASTATELDLPLDTGFLALDSDQQALFPHIHSDYRADQLAGAQINNLQVTDNRNSLDGWSLTATMGNLTAIQPFRRTTDRAIDTSLSAQGAMSDGGNAIYYLTITQAGTAEQAQYEVSGREALPAATLHATQPLGSFGLSFTADPNHIFAVGEKWMLRVDTLQASQLSIAPGALTITGGDTTDVIPGDNHTFSSATDIATLITAAAGAGDGTYGISPNLTLSIPKATHSGEYHGSLVETVF